MADQRNRVTIWLLAIMLGAFISLPSDAETLTVLTHQLPPFTTGTVASPTGLAVDLVRALLLHTGDRGDIAVVPYARLLRDVQQGPLTVGFIVARTPQRERLMQWVGPFMVSGVYLYKKAGAPMTISSLADARKLAAIGVTRGDIDARFLEEQHFDNLDYSENQAADLQKLRLGRLDATPMGAIVFDHAVRDAGLQPSEFEQTKVKLYESRVCFAFSPDVPGAVVQGWAAALAGMQASGEFAALLARYGITASAAGIGPPNAD
jgi:polar amino acid transport system substrate-binding protein